MQATSSEAAPASTNDVIDLVWGAAEIGKVINTGPRKAYYLLSAGLLPARKCGRDWVASRSALRRHFGEGA